MALSGFAIIGIAGLAAATGGIAVPSLLAGGLAFSAFGGLAGVSLGAGVGSMLLGQGAREPESGSRVSRNLVNIADAGVPNKLRVGLTYGGYSRTYIRIAGGQTELTLIDGVICDHPISAVHGVAVNGDYLALVPDRLPNTTYQVGDKVAMVNTETDGDTPPGTYSSKRTYTCDVSGQTSSSSTGPGGTGQNITDGAARWDHDDEDEAGLVINSIGGSPWEPDVGLTWWVAAKNSKYHRTDETKRSVEVPEDVKSHVNFSFRLGTQTAPDSSMNSLAGSAYSNDNRVGKGRTVFSAVIRANSEVNTMSTPELHFHIDGSNKVRDPRDSWNETFTKNAALNAAYVATKVFPGLGVTLANSATAWQNVFRTANLSAAADACDDVMADGSTRYRIDGEIAEDPTRAHETMAELCEHFHGGWWERGGVIRFWVGAPRTSVTSLSRDDIAGDQGEVIYHRFPDPDSKFNTVIPWFTQQQASGGEQLWKLVDAARIQEATYLAEDDGVELVVDRKWPYCTNRPRVRNLAQVELEKHRIGSRYVNVPFHLNERTFILEPGDVFEWTDPDYGFDADLFQVVEPPRIGLNVTFITFSRYDDAIYTMDALPDTDVGVSPNTSRGPLAKPTGLVAVVDPDSTPLEVLGTVRVDVILSWDAIADIRMMAGGTYKVRRRQSSTLDWDDPWGVEVPGVTSQVRIPSIRAGVSYDFQVRAKSVDIDGHGSEWSDVLTFIPVAAAIGPGLPSGAGAGINLVSEPSFDQGGIGWDLGGNSGQSGSAVWQATGGRSTPPCIVVTTDGEDFNAPKEKVAYLHPVTPGEMYYASARVRRDPTSGTTNSRFSYKILFYDSQKRFLTGPEVFIDGTFHQATDNLWHRYWEYIQVPRGVWDVQVAPGDPDEPIAYARIEFIARYDTTNTQNSVWVVDDFEFWRVPEFPGQQPTSSTGPHTGLSYQQFMGTGRALWLPPEGLLVRMQVDADWEAITTALTTNNRRLQVRGVLYRESDAAEITIFPSSGTDKRILTVNDGVASGREFSGTFSKDKQFDVIATGHIPESDQFRIIWRMRNDNSSGEVSFTVSDRSSTIAFEGEAET